MNEQYISIRRILDDLMAHPMLQDLTMERAINYAVDFIRIVGCPQFYSEKIEQIEIDNYRGKLPCDFYSIIQVRDPNSHICYKHASDTFHTSGCKHADITYKIQGNVIFTSTKEGTIEIAYNAYNLDEDGYIMLPDNSSFIRALEAYIKVKQFTILFDMGKMQAGVLQNAQQEYAWAVGDCQSEFNRMSIDEMESFTNSWRTLLIRDNQQREGFARLGNRQNIKVH